MRDATHLSYPMCDAAGTGFFCKKCQAGKVRCPGCDKIVCFCEKRNGHITGPTLIFCIGKS